MKCNKIIGLVALVIVLVILGFGFLKRVEHFVITPTTTAPADDAPLDLDALLDALVAAEEAAAAAGTTLPATTKPASIPGSATTPVSLTGTVSATSVSAVLSSSTDSSITTPETTKSVVNINKKTIRNIPPHIIASMQKNRYRAPRTNLLQKKFEGTSNVLTPFLYIDE